MIFNFKVEVATNVYEQHIHNSHHLSYEAREFLKNLSWSDDGNEVHECYFRIHKPNDMMYILQELVAYDFISIDVEIAKIE